MANCEMLAKCVFFNDKVQNMPSTAELMKHRYCRGDNSDCARYKIVVSIGKEKVPPDLFPHEGQKAGEIIYVNT